MENREEQKTFHYAYSAKQQEEIRAIRKKYAAGEEEDALTTLRRLDAGVTQKATAVSLVVGIIGALILGFGMSLVMSDLGEMLGRYRETAMPIGIAVGVAGILLTSSAYPLYGRIVKRERKKRAPEILRLTDELMK